ncbi:MAG: pentapeptide repeat-containing protein [Prochloraceae cyanobacterium]|nr:pentapeptide repeat-containing protein [Prochloraceae cyanobacterium]
MKKKQKITYTATDEGLERAERALKRDFGAKTNFAKSSYISRSTITKFFSKKPIQFDCFEQICKELKLSNWQEIAGINPTDIVKNIKVNNAVSNSPNEGNEPVQTITRREITVEDESNNTVLAVISLQGDINSAPNQKTFEDILKNYSGKKIIIKDIKEGSIKLFVEGSSEDIKQIRSLIESKEITELSGFPIEKIEILDKWTLVKKIVNRSLKTKNLRNADLSGANLSNADLSNADLGNADLSNADLSNADLIGADLRDANLSGADLIGAHLSTDLSGANLSVANLRGANLSVANLRGANLSVANLIGANLSGANLRDANLRDANLISADLIDANLIDANLNGAEVKNAHFGYNPGISKEMRLDLIKRRAIFEGDSRTFTSV